MSVNPDIQILYDPVSRMVCPYCRNRMDVSGLQAFSKGVCPSCKNEVPVPARLGAFLLLDLLGTGGMGGVFRAHDETLGRDVAIKVMLKALGDNAEFVQTFRREAQAAAKLNHPHIAQIYSFGQEKGQPYIVMELVPGKHFDTLICGPEPTDPAFVMRVGAEIAEGLQVASAAGLVHGDIKPENILLDERGQAKLVDFGIAGNVNQSQGEIWGTPYYIAPEKVRRQRIDHRSDIYCLGGTLYHALAGHPPFDGKDALEVVKARFRGPPEPLAKVRPGLDADVVAIIDRMLQLEPAMRYPTYESLLGDMRRYLSHAAPAAPTVGAGKRIVVKGKNRTVGGLGVTGPVPGAATTGSNAGASTTSSHKNLTVTRGMTAAEGAAAAAGAGGGGASAGAAPRKRRGRRALVVTAIVLALLGAAAGTVFGVRRHLANAASREAEQERRVALAALDAVLVAAAQSHTSILQSTRLAKAATNEALAIAVQELGESCREQVEVPDPPPEDSAPAGTNGVAEAATNAPPATPTVDPETMPPLVRLARKVCEYGPTMGQVERNAQRAAERLAEIRAEAGVSTNAAERIRRLTLKAEVYRTSVESIASRAAEWQRGAQAKLQELKDFAQGESERRRRAEQARKADEAARLAAEEKARAEQAQREAVAADLARVSEAEAGLRESLQGHRYDEALRVLRALEEGVKTPDGQKALRAATERVEYLRDLKTFLTAKLAAGDFVAPAGWSVQAASDRTVTVRSASGKVDDVPWNRIGLNQMVPFIQFYLLDEQRTRTLKLRELIRQSLAGARYCLTFGEGRPAAREMAAKLVQQALDKFPDARIEAERIAPEVLAQAP